MNLKRDMIQCATLTSYMRMLWLRGQLRLRGFKRKWNEHLTGKKDEVLAEPFPTFITWLQSQRLVLERVSAANASIMLWFSNKKSSTFIDDVEKDVAVVKRLVKDNCPKKPKGPNGQKKNKNTSKQTKV